jgi:hypothetical protein
MLLVILSACSTTKLVPDDDQLFIGLEAINYENYEENDHFTATQEELEAALATQPNGALFGSSYYRTPFPYGLWVWNYAYGSSGKFKKWLLKSFGKAPVLMSKVNPQLRASVAKSVLQKNGYMHGDVTFTEVKQKNPKKAKIGYTVRMDTLFTIDTMNYVGFPTDMKALIDSAQSYSYIKTGSPFATSLLDAERTRISQMFRNNGYYYFSPAYSSYLADTFQVENRVQLRLQMADSLPDAIKKKWYIGRMSISLRHSAREQLTDSMDRRFLKVLYTGKRPPIRPSFILRSMKLRPRQLYSYDDYYESMQKINSSGVFSQTDFVFTPRPDTDTLDLSLNCIFDKPYDFYFEANVINRTIGRLGPEVKIGVTRRNAFHRGEKLDINLHGSYEWQTSGDGSHMDSYQYGADVSVEFPRIIAPFFGERQPKRTKDGKFKRRKPYYSTPWTIAKISADIIQRPNYYKMQIISGEWTYRWQKSESSRHELSPLTLKYQYMSSSTDKFKEVLLANPYLSVTMDDYFIPKMRYTYTYASPSKKRHPIRWETTVEESGNVISLCELAFGKEWNEKNKTLFNNPYSQFFKIETDFSKTWQLNAKSQLVAHANAGIIWCYGNSSDYPFSEGFYVGGANSLRAFSVRSIGPGAFVSTGNRQNSYLMQNGNSKLVMNLEYRRQLFGNLYGALFLDAGNVWSSRNWSANDTDIVQDSQYEDTKFRLSTFLKQLATGTGLGLRYDLEFLVLRVDWGFGLHVPYHTSKSGYFNIERFKDMQTLHIAIGYPF